jgi:hypothetical protein
MKRAFLFLILLPQIVSAHREDPRVRREVPYAGVKTVTKITFFTLPKENDKLDTSIIETYFYNPEGFLTQHDLSMIMQKNPEYMCRETYSYSAADAWTQHVYRRGVLTDSVRVNGTWANCYLFHDGKPEIVHEYRGDSLQEKLINGTDTVYWAKKQNRFVGRDSFWDYDHAGSFARTTTAHSSDGSDTVSYLDDAGRCLVRYISHHNRTGQITRIDYYNYEVKRFDFKRLTYSEKMEMTFFLEKSRNEQWSYQVLYMYNDSGQLAEEKWIDPDPKKNQIVIRYAYEFY